MKFCLSFLLILFVSIVNSIPNHKPPDLEQLNEEADTFLAYRYADFGNALLPGGDLHPYYNYLYAFVNEAHTINQETLKDIQSLHLNSFKHLMGPEFLNEKQITIEILNRIRDNNSYSCHLVHFGIESINMRLKKVEEAEQTEKTIKVKTALTEIKKDLIAVEMSMDDYDALIKAETTIISYIKSYVDALTTGDMDQRVSTFTLIINKMDVAINKMLHLVKYWFNKK